MYKLHKQFEISTGHRLQHHEGGCSNLHGHNYLVDVKIVFTSDENIGGVGFDIDFGSIKKVINENFDHKMIICKEDEYADILKDLKGVVLVDYQPTAENLSLAMMGLIREILKDKIGEIVIELHETNSSYIERYDS